MQRAKLKDDDLRLKWLGHTAKMEDNVPCRQVARFVSDKTACGNLCLTYGNFYHGYIKSLLYPYFL